MSGFFSFLSFNRINGKSGQVIFPASAEAPNSTAPPGADSSARGSKGLLSKELEEKPVWMVVSGSCRLSYL